ncbi:hypothetical protein ADIMK_3760 [Marinobacterium lacunae]|uniref:Uncharacterized protein n=1 Tax=Marinobacterium lacunae TaxID=1232683 RepID=A0A081FU94_9GAMM|nr:hypothetical protein ADIMK_3760 [Marinobacterium lacunae]
MAEAETYSESEGSVQALTGTLPPSSWTRFKPSFPTLEAIHSRSSIVLWDEIDDSYNKSI